MPTASNDDTSTSCCSIEEIATFVRRQEEEHVEHVPAGSVGWPGGSSAEAAAAAFQNVAARGPAANRGTPAEGVRVLLANPANLWRGGADILLQWRQGLHGAAGPVDALPAPGGHLQH